MPFKVNRCVVVLLMLMAFATQLHALAFTSGFTSNISTAIENISADHHIMLNKFGCDDNRNTACIDAVVERSCCTECDASTTCSKVNCSSVVATTVWYIYSGLKVTPLKLSGTCLALLTQRDMPFYRPPILH